MALPSVIEVLVKDIAVEFDFPQNKEEPPEVYLASLLMRILEDINHSSSTRHTVDAASSLHILAEAKAALASGELPQSFLKRVEKERKINGRRQYYAAYKRRQRA